MIVNDVHNRALNSPVRNIGVRVDVYKDAVYERTFFNTDAIKSYTVERVSQDGKFFGFGVCQKLNLKLIDKERVIDINTSHSLEVMPRVKTTSGNDNIKAFPMFYVSEVHRDENTGELSITAYDALYSLGGRAITEALAYTVAPYSVYTYADCCAKAIGGKLALVNISASDAAFMLIYEEGANFEGTESIRELLDAIAEATQTIYYIAAQQYGNNVLTFKRLDKSNEAIFTIGKDRYITLNSGNNRRLTEIIHVTDLGDNVGASLAQSGSTQYIRNNPLWELREDIAEIVNNALEAIGGLTINQFECSWRGNYLLEIGDKIALVTKDNSIVNSFVLDDVISYNGGLEQKTQWSYKENEEESASNPTNLGEALKQTFARVDKANKQIDIVVSETQANSEAIAAIQLNTEDINLSIQKIEQINKETAESLNGELEELTKKVDLALTEEQVNIAIRSELDNGVNKIVTNTGFVFDDTGLTVERDNSEMKTTITEDGMTVYKDNTAMLTANNAGVDAVNLRATTYLIIGNNSRLEDYASNRTGCFWIGG